METVLDARVNLFARHRGMLNRAVEACRTRANWTAFSDDPAAHPGGPAARAAGLAWFELQCGQPFDLDQPGTMRVQADEQSPYTGQPLGIAYPQAGVDTLVAAAERAWPAWRDTDHERRIGVCLEICEQLYRRAFELAAAAMHTTGQSFGMSYTGSGTNAIDRGVEAIAQVHQAVSRVAPTATWSRQFGKATVELEKRYRLMPLGVGAVLPAPASRPGTSSRPCSPAWPPGIR